MARFDLTDEEWVRIQPLLPPQRSGKRGRPYSDHRKVINGILWIDRTGAPWRDLPERYGPFSTCHDRQMRWQEEGVWGRVLAQLIAQEDAQTPLVLTLASVDATNVRAHQHAAGACKKGAMHRTGKSRSRLLKSFPSPKTRDRSRHSGAAEAVSPPS